jgi:hypothetical protein
MNHDDFNELRDKFLKFAHAYWDSMGTEDAKAANRRTHAFDKLARKWRADGIADKVLAPFLTDASPKVRFSAACYLLDTPARESAISVLRELRREPSLISSSAVAVLDFHKIDMVKR